MKKIKSLLYKKTIATGENFELRMRVIPPFFFFSLKSVKTKGKSRGIVAKLILDFVATARASKITE